MSSSIFYEIGFQVTSYGGKMEIELEYSGAGAHSDEPLVVLKASSWFSSPYFERLRSVISKFQRSF